MADTKIFIRDIGMVLPSERTSEAEQIYQVREAWLAVLRAKSNDKITTPNESLKFKPKTF